MSGDCCRSNIRDSSASGDAKAPVRNIADLELYGPDTMGETILAIYGRNPPDYAVYRTRERVKIQYADRENAERNAAQRKDMAQLNPIRGEINGCIDGWRLKPCRSRFGRKAERYDRRVGDALVVAFEDDLAGAHALLDKIKQEILDERTSIARFWYLLAALGASIALGGLIWAATHWLWFSPEGREIWTAALTGSAGAFFSIALAIRKRTVLPDLQMIGNTMDAALRIVIGVMGAAVLISLISSGAVRLAIGDADFNLRSCPVAPATATSAEGRSVAERPAAEPPAAPSPQEAADAGSAGVEPGAERAPSRAATVSPPDPDNAKTAQDAAKKTNKADDGCTDKRWLFVLLIGFIAGFAERLVPDLLDKAVATPTPPPSPKEKKGSDGAIAPDSSSRTKAAGASAAGSAANASSAASASPDGPDPDDTGEDHCACDITLPQDQETADADLPAAAGGVAPLTPPAN